VAVDSSSAASAAEGASSLIFEPNLFTYAPWLPALTKTIVEGNPGQIASYSNTVANVAQDLKGHSKDLVKQGEDTKSFWSGGAAGDAFDALFTVGTAIGDHAGQVGHYASTGLKLANDFKRLINLVNNGQKMADGVVAALSKIPYVGHALAEAYALKTAIWTGLCAAQLVNIGQDVVNLVKDINPKKVSQAYTPPTATPTVTTTAQTYDQHHATTPFG
jgi:hypothetical protein